MVEIIETAASFPDHYYQQEEITEFLLDMWPEENKNLARLEEFHEHALVKGRYLSCALEDYLHLDEFEERNDIWIETALSLGEAATNQLLEKAGMAAEEVSVLAVVSTTGLAVPPIDARLMNRIPFSKELKRMPFFGFGCLGGVAGIARVADYLEGHPGEAGILLSIEPCSLTVQRDDLSIANMIASGLFGDGAAAVLLAGSDHPLSTVGKPRVIGTRSVQFEDTERVMGWDISSSGFKIVLSPEIPDLAENGFPPYVREFLSEYGLEARDIRYWIAHPGGPRVIEGIQKGLDLPQEAMALSWESLRSVGNLSSASVLLVLDETLQRYQPEPGAYGLMMALGPGFSAELVLLQW